jgi:hypothetical protein
METHTTARADLWDLAVALYKISLSSKEEMEKWDRHAASFISHALEGNVYAIGVADSYAAEYYGNMYSEELRIPLIKAGAPEDVFASQAFRDTFQMYSLKGEETDE